MGFTVLIVGGSVSGLSLALMLEHFGIDYLLLEAHSTVAPQLGASLGLLPGGLRILDQLGCYEKIHNLAGNTYYNARMRLFSGDSWIDTKETTFSEKLEERYVADGTISYLTNTHAMVGLAIPKFSSIDKQFSRSCWTV